MNNPLRVLYILRATLVSVKGGDTIQATRTAEALRNLGVKIDIHLCNDSDIVYANYDFIHFFNIIRPADILPHIKKSNLPYVISTIYVDYSYYEKSDHSIKGRILHLFGSNTREYLKALARMLFNGEKINSSQYLFWGHKKAIQTILKNALWLLPNSESEYQRLLKDYGIANDYTTVYNAADTHLFHCTETDVQNKNLKMVLCVARIEGRKNQLNLIKALNHSEYELYLIGNPAPNHLKYYNTCKQTAASNVHFISELTQLELVDYYKQAKVHVLPSWFETTGLSSLEALFSGCTIVATKFGDTQDYFKDEIVYCEPNSPASIKAAIDKAANSQTNKAYLEKMRATCNWKFTAETTLQIYKKAITKHEDWHHRN